MLQAAEALSARAYPELSIVVPTRDEVENVEPLVRAIENALDDASWEIIFVDDDSSDGTSQRVREMARADPRIRLIQRVDRSGLSSACIEGMMASVADYVAVMDADLQHDERLLAEMLQHIRKSDIDLVVASRYMTTGSLGDLSESRQKLSRLATQVTKSVMRTPLSDPMSGFFMITRDAIDSVYSRLYGHGFKILIDICATSPHPLRLHELPFRMRDRHAGESKISLWVMGEFGVFLLAKIFGRLIPERFIMFGMIGLSGVAVHMALLGTAHRLMGYSFLLSQIIATYVAMTSNYVLNNRFTFGDMRRTGKSFWTGLLSFMLVCSMGAMIGVAVGEVLYQHDIVWWLSGFVATLVVALWNFSLSSNFTWRRSLSQWTSDE